ncbi:MAG: nucleotidyltransferase domain-containing protein [Bacteroidota bacterium]
MDKRINSTIKKFVNSVAENTPGLVSAYLFGSYAKNKQTEDSDIDIALVIENLSENERFDVQIQLMMLASKFDSRIEPHPLSLFDLSSSNPFFHEILKTGKKIKIKTNT